MARLILGVNDVAYSDASGNGATTTGHVAEILEDRYHVMQTFYDVRKGRIAEFLAEAYGSALQDLFAGRKGGKPAYDAGQRIEAEFRSFLDANEMQRLALVATGFPISLAAVAGVNHRKKHPYAQKNRARPAFIDTGLYRASFRAQLVT